MGFRVQGIYILLVVVCIASHGIILNLQASRIQGLCRNHRGSAGSGVKRLGFQGVVSSFRRPGVKDSVCEVLFGFIGGAFL